MKNKEQIMLRHGCLSIAETGDRKMANRKKKRKKKGRKKLVLFVFEILLLAVLLGSLAIYQSTMGRIKHEPKLDVTEAGINEDLDTEELEGYTNIALLGLDNRSNGNFDSGNSDTIMVASIDNKTSEVRLVSVYRDTYLNVGGGKYRKANAAFANGGVAGAVQMLNTNLDLDITDYVCVDWNAVVEAIDALGGVEIEISDGERQQINKYLHDVTNTTGVKSSAVNKTGLVRLDGAQATTYARIRHLAGDDYKRASRQRIVIQAMLTEAKKSDVVTLTKICNAVCDDISTSLTNTEMLSYISKIMDYEIVETSGFPFELTTANLAITRSTVVPISLENNVSELHKFLFKDEEYTVSDTVKNISDNIIYATGVTAQSQKIDTSTWNNTAGKTGADQK